MKSALKLTALAVFATLTVAAAPFEKDFSFEMKQCSEAPSARSCAVKLRACHTKLFRKLSAESPTANLGMALYYHCLEEQNVAIPGVD
jgi:hypothetical protein